METKTNPTLTRRRQRRPDLQSAFDIPEDLQQLLSNVARTLKSVVTSGEELKLTGTEKVISATDNALQDLLQPSLTPAQQLHAISKITGAIKDIPKAQLESLLTANTGLLYTWGRTLVLEAVVPMLLDCRVRYLHRALMTLLRVVVPSTDAATEAVVRQTYVTRVLQRASAGASVAAAASTSSASKESAAAAAATLYFPSAKNGVCNSVAATRDTVLNFLNSVDGLTSTLMPMMPSVFKDTFLEVLPLLAECFQWVVVNATSHIHSPVGVDLRSGTAVATVSPAAIEESRGEVAVGSRDDDEKHNEEVGGNKSNAVGALLQAQSGPMGGTVFGEDLEHIRFCVRVVATYIHKYMDSLTFAMLSGTAGDDVSRQLARLLQPTVVMLASPVFPKDVLNAVGLLVASILTVRTCNGWLLSVVCTALRDAITQSAAATGAAEGAPQKIKSFSGGAAVGEAKCLENLFDCAEVALGVVCAADPQAASRAHNGAGAKALHDLFTAFTPNGCFALLKGILAHMSSPIRGDWMSLGVLLSPQGTVPTVVAYDTILPAAQEFCNTVQEPETRFMAIQTVDSVVRHVSTVLSTATAALRRSRDAAKKVGAPSLSDATGVEKGAALTVQACQHLASLCVFTPKLRAALSFSTQLIMALWDDGTQQMSGALYDTYNEILKISETLHICRQQQLASGEGGTAIVMGAETDVTVTLDQILDVQAERRGKYHALLGHLSMMPIGSFIQVLQRHYHSEDLVAGAVAAFSRMLLSGASNHKIGNVAGDVFAQLARAIKGASSDAALTSSSGGSRGRTETVADVLRQGIVEPLARSIAEKGYVGVSSNVSESVNISHIAAHFVAPLVKQDPSSLEAILSTVAGKPSTSANTSDSHACERVEQGVVEVLSRARGVGIDIVPYIAPGSAALSVLEASTHSLNYDVRNSALCLCVLATKKIQAVQNWQMEKMEEYLILNMHLGGDSTAQKGLLEMLKKWVRRLAESYTSRGTSAGADKDAATAAKKQRREELAGVAAGAAPSSSSGSTPEVLELGTPTYRQAVMQHCVRLANIFAQNIGVNLRASLGLAAERRVTAMKAYVVLVQGFRTVMKGEIQETAWLATKENAQRGLLHACVVPSLIATLSDGWSQARDSAQELLYLFCDLAPAAVFAEAGGTGSGGANASDAGLVEGAHQDLLKAQTYRNAEGAVRRFLLFSTRSLTTQANVQHHPQQELQRLNALLNAERKSVLDKCTDMNAMRGSSSYAYIQANPLHGSLSLCSELLGCMSAVDRQLSLSAVQNGEAAVVMTGTALTQACTQLLQCCCVVLRTCSSLVGTETVTAGATASLGEEEVVDCRGHVYDRSRPEAESVMRGVVNNTWLSMRVSTAAADRILKVCPVHLLPFDVVRSAAYELVHTLLLTKHNGVMRCVREALKSLTATLVRSRAPQFYQLPAELLEYLLGPEGVTSGDIARMLRRSQGLPHAILAVLEAEDTAVPYCLFPIAMRQLMRVARGDFELPGGTVGHFNNLGSTLDDVRRSQRSNALNVLKFIFEDKVFADRVVAYIEEAFSLATEGFHDASWYTRNSSLMLFSAVIHRFVGEHPSTGGSGVNTSLHDVAMRTPRGVAYAYAELSGGNGLTDGVATGDSSSSPTSGATASPEVNVALFPVLQLLSMLSPDPPHLITKASHSEWDDTARMSEAVLRCADSPSLMVRSASAVALCCLVPIASLSRVIARTKRGLALLPYEAASLSGNINDAVRGPRKHEHVDRGTSGGLNACHGALLQLLQFHAQYVGTLRRHYKQKRSSYATVAVSETVCHAICEAVLSCHSILVAASAVCPTVTAALFALLADLVYYGPQQHLSESQQQALRGLCVAALKAYILSSQGVLERGSVMEGASAMIVFMASQRGAPVGAWSASEQQCLTQILHREAAGLVIGKGEHTMISWIATQLLHYSDLKKGIMDKETVAAVLQVLGGELQCDVSSLILQTLSDFFGHSAAAFSKRGTSVANIGCLAWGQLVTHLRFTATTIALRPNNGAFCATRPSNQGSADKAHSPSSATAGSVSDVVGSSSLVHRLYETVSDLLTLPENGSASTAASSLWRNSDACSAALELVVCYDMHATPALAISPRLARNLAYYAEPEQPLESRLAVVKALRTAQPFLRRSVSAAGMLPTSFPESSVTLFLVLLRLLVDDTSDIREAASTICSYCLWGPQQAPRDQVSCLLAVVRLLRQLHVSGRPLSASAVKAMLAITEISDDDATLREEGAAARAEADCEDDEDGEDVLFQKEAANMFAEETVLQCLLGHIFGADAPHDVAAASRGFSVFDALLK